MRSSEVGSYQAGIIKIVSFCVEIGITDPVVEILNAFFISPEEFNSFCITGTIVIVSIIRRINRHGLHQVIIFFVIGFCTEYPVVSSFLVSENIVSCFGIVQILCKYQLLVL